jgi:hypothetical protein
MVHREHRAPEPALADTFVAPAAGKRHWRRFQAPFGGGIDLARARPTLSLASEEGRMATSLAMLLSALWSGMQEPAAPPEAAPPAPRAAIEVSGFVDTYYAYNFNRPSGDTQLRNFDTKHNQVSLNLVEVALEQRPAPGHRLGFRADLQFGPATDLVHAAEPGGADVFKSFEQAYVSFLAPLGGGLQLDVGKFVTPLGAEVIEARDNWNYSRSLLFALAVPYYHAGLRATWSVRPGVTAAAFFVNGWNNGVDNNGGKTVGLQASVKPHPRLSLVQSVMAGPEQADDDSTRLLSDTVATWTVTPAVSVMANLDYGRDRIGGERVSWSGVALGARAQVHPLWAVGARVERLRDGHGFMTGAAQTLHEVTLTGEHRAAEALLVRLEYRRDLSDRQFFTGRTGARRSQDTLVIGIVYAFAARL